MSMKYPGYQGNVPIFDNGHAGMNGGHYATEGKRSPDWAFGVLFEGMFNRWVVNLTMRELDYAGVPYYHVSPELDDVSLGTRVRRANTIMAINPDAYLISIHANAGRGTGVEVFTSPGQTDSDPLATYFLNNFKAEFESQGWRIREDISDGDPDKEEGFYVLKYTTRRGFLFECGFMDHPWDYAQLWSQDYQQALACNFAKSIIELYRNEKVQLA